MITNEELFHYGVKGMKWGVRRYQNKNGTLTNAAKKRSVQQDGVQNQESSKKKPMSTAKKIAIGAGVTAAIIGGAYGAYKINQVVSDKRMVKKYFDEFSGYTKDKRDIASMKWDDLKDLDIEKMQSDSRRVYERIREARRDNDSKAPKMVFGEPRIMREGKLLIGKEFDRKNRVVDSEARRIVDRIDKLENRYFIKEPYDHIKERKQRK